MRLLRVRGLAEIGKVASGSATQDPWLGNRKVGISGSRRRPKPTSWERNS